MGRANEALKGVVGLQLLKMCTCCGAYDSGGAYWGVGSPEIGYMYVAEDSEGCQFFTRAKTRMEAKKNVTDKNPNVTFKR